MSPTGIDATSLRRIDNQFDVMCQLECCCWIYDERLIHVLLLHLRQYLVSNIFLVSHDFSPLIVSV